MSSQATNMEEGYSSCDSTTSDASFDSCHLGEVKAEPDVTVSVKGSFAFTTSGHYSTVTAISSRPVGVKREAASPHSGPDPKRPRVSRNPLTRVRDPSAGPRILRGGVVEYLPKHDVNHALLAASSPRPAFIPSKAAIIAELEREIAEERVSSASAVLSPSTRCGTVFPGPLIPLTTAPATFQANAVKRRATKKVSAPKSSVPASQAKSVKRRSTKKVFPAKSFQALSSTPSLQNCNQTIKSRLGVGRGLPRKRPASLPVNAHHLTPMKRFLPISPPKSFTSSLSSDDGLATATAALFGAGVVPLKKVFTSASPGPAFEGGAPFSVTMALPNAVSQGVQTDAPPVTTTSTQTGLLAEPIANLDPRSVISRASLIVDTTSLLSFFESFQILAMDEKALTSLARRDVQRMFRDQCLWPALALEEEVIHAPRLLEILRWAWTEQLSALAYFPFSSVEMRRQQEHRVVLMLHFLMHCEQEALRYIQRAE